MTYVSETQTPLIISDPQASDVKPPASGGAGSALEVACVWLGVLAVLRGGKWLLLRYQGQAIERKVVVVLIT